MGSAGVLALGVARLRAHVVFSSHLSVLFFFAVGVRQPLHSQRNGPCYGGPSGSGSQKREASFLSVNQSLQRTLIGPAWVTCTPLWAGRRGFVMGSSNVIPVVKERHAGEWRSSDVRCSEGAGILSWTTGAGSYFDHYHLHFPPLHLKMLIIWSCYKTLCLCCSCKYSHLGYKGSILLVSCYLSTAAKAMQRLACPSASPLLHGGSEQTFPKEPSRWAHSGCHVLGTGSLPWLPFCHHFHVKKK